MSVTTWHPKQEMCRNPEFEELLREKSEACKKSLEAEKDELKRWALLCRIKVMELLMDRENVTFDMAKEECEVFEEHGLTAEAGRETEELLCKTLWKKQRIMEGNGDLQTNFHRRDRRQPRGRQGRA